MRLILPYVTRSFPQSVITNFSKKKHKCGQATAHGCGTNVHGFRHPAMPCGSYFLFVVSNHDRVQFAGNLLPAVGPLAYGMNVFDL